MGIRVLRARGRCVDSGEAGPGLQVGDADFEGVVLDKAHDTFVLFYRPHPLFCASNGTAYAAYDVPQPSVKVCRRCVPLRAAWACLPNPGTPEALARCLSRSGYVWTWPSTNRHLSLRTPSCLC
jgi:hypothetical protein